MPLPETPKKKHSLKHFSLYQTTIKNYLDQFEADSKRDLHLE